MRTCDFFLGGSYLSQCSSWVPSQVDLGPWVLCRLPVLPGVGQSLHGRLYPHWQKTGVGGEGVRRISAGVAEAARLGTEGEEGGRWGVCGPSFVAGRDDEPAEPAGVAAGPE